MMSEEGFPEDKLFWFSFVCRYFIFLAAEINVNGCRPSEARSAVACFKQQAFSCCSHIFEAEK